MKHPTVAGQTNGKSVKQFTLRAWTRTLPDGHLARREYDEIATAIADAHAVVREMGGLPALEYRLREASAILGGAL